MCVCVYVFVCVYVYVCVCVYVCAYLMVVLSAMRGEVLFTSVLSSFIRAV